MLRNALSKIAQPRVLLGALLAGVVILRLAYLIFFGYTLNLQASGYDVYAQNLLSGHGYTRFADLHQDSDLPPLYSFFLAGVYTLLGRSAIYVALVQIVFDVVTVLTIYTIGRRLGGQAMGLLAAVFTGFYPYLLFQNLTTNDSAIFIMLLALGISRVYRAYDRRSWKQAAFAGVMFGIGALTKSLVLLLLPMIGIWWLLVWWRSEPARALARVAALGIGAAVVIAPWIIRNTVLHGALTFISTNDGSNLYQGNNPCVADYLSAGWDAQWVDCLNSPPAGLTELQEAAWYREQALAYLRDHVGDWPRLFGVKLLNLWSPELMPRAVPPQAKLGDNGVLQYEQPAFQAARVIHLIYFTPLLILGVIGLWRGWRNRLLIGPVVMVLMAITITYLIYHPSTRYRLPADPFLFVLSAYGALWLARLFVARFFRRLPRQPDVAPSNGQAEST